MKLTIKDIARMAGVSVSAVSKCINDYPDIGEATRRKVMAIMKQTGFKPSFSAKSLISKRTHMIGVIFGHQVHYDFTHIYFTEILNAFKEAIGRKGYDLLMFSNQTAQAEGDDYLDRCLHYNVDGCLIFAAAGVWEAVRELDRSEIPCVGIDLTMRGNRSASVNVDNERVGREAAHYLLAQGHSQIGYIGSGHAEPIYKKRETGFRSALIQAGASIQENWFLHTSHHLEQDGYMAARELLSQEKLPTALFIASDLLALGAIRGFKDSGIRLPEQLSIIGCDNIYPGSFVDPPLTTVSQNKEMIGTSAAEMLHRLMEERIHTPDVAPKRTTDDANILIQPTIVIRSSVLSVSPKLKPVGGVAPRASVSGKQPDSAASWRLAVLQLAESIGNVSAACKQFGISRTRFYEYKNRFEQRGPEGLKNGDPTLRKAHPRATPPDVIALLLGISRGEPTWGCTRLSQELKKRGFPLSGPTVQHLLNKYGLGTRQARLLAQETSLGKGAQPVQTES